MLGRNTGYADRLAGDGKVRPEFIDMLLHKTGLVTGRSQHHCLFILCDEMRVLRVRRFLLLFLYSELGLYRLYKFLPISVSAREYCKLFHITSLFVYS